MSCDCTAARKDHNCFRTAGEDDIGVAGRWRVLFYAKCVINFDTLPHMYMCMYVVVMCMQSYCNRDVAHFSLAHACDRMTG